MQRSSSIYLYVTPAFSLLFQSFLSPSRSLARSLILFISYTYLVVRVTVLLHLHFLFFFFPSSSFFLFCSSISVSFDRIESFDLWKRKESERRISTTTTITRAWFCRYFCFRWVSKSIAMTCQDGANAFYDSLKIHTDRVNRDKIKLSSRRSSNRPFLRPGLFFFFVRFVERFEA